MTHPPLALVQDLGWTLVHFLWQGLLLALLLQAILPLCRGAVARHNWALGTLALMSVTPAVTFSVLHGQQNHAAAPMPGTGMALAISIPPLWLDGLVAFWLAGIAVLSLRALGGWLLAENLRRRDTLALPAEIERRCRTLAQRLAGAWPIRFVQSHRVRVPVVVGWLRPVILLPLSAIAGLAPAQLDALVLHELAHIRRLDAFTNLALIAVETILFYHPAVWWVSRRVRIEREHCCDDLAVSHCGDAAGYVEALTSLEKWKIPAPVLAAGGGRLKQRAARLLEAPADCRKFSFSALVGLVFLGAAAATVGAAQPAMGQQNFAIRVVDESVTGDARQGPPGEDRMRLSQPQKTGPAYLWLRREGLIGGNILGDAHAARASDGSPVIVFRLTTDGKARFAALTEANIGHRLAVVVKGKVVSAPRVLDAMRGGAGQISGFDTPAQARAVAAEMMGAGAR